VTKSEESESILHVLNSKGKEEKRVAFPSGKEVIKVSSMSTQIGVLTTSGFEILRVSPQGSIEETTVKCSLV